jgi:hypothetical protein
LKEETGFQMLMSQVKGIKDPDSAIIIVSLPPLPKKRQVVRNAYETEAIASSDGQRDDGTMYSKKVCFCIVCGLADRFQLQINLDDQLVPIIDMLEGTHPIGSCPTHSSICCYVQEPQGWHFEINSIKLKVWANAIE